MMTDSGRSGARGATRRLGVSAAIVDGRIVRGDVAIRDEEIVGVGLAGRGSGLATPGFVDAQVNGYAGVDILGADEAGLELIAAALLRDGVAAYQPTLITAGEEELLAALAVISRVASRRRDGARILGVHLEGPFLSPERSGTHPVEHLRRPDPRLLEQLLAAGPVGMVTLAPELPGTLELIEICIRHGVVVSLGHSGATAAQAAAAFAAGAKAVTHLFNAMSPVSARRPGLATAALSTPGVAVQLIADGVHVADELIAVAFAAAAGRVSLVSDAISAAPGSDGEFRLGSVEVIVKDGVARRVDGTIAGGTARLADSLARLAALGIATEDAVASVCERPARLLGAQSFGCCQIGGRADLVVLDDQLRLARVLAGGREVERNGGSA